MWEGVEKKRRSQVIVLQYSTGGASRYLAWQMAMGGVPDNVLPKGWGNGEGGKADTE